MQVASRRSLTRLVCAQALLVGACAILGCGGERVANPIDKALDALLDEPVQVSGGGCPWPSTSSNMTALVRAGRPDVPYLIERLKDRDLRVRMHCATALGEIGDRRAAGPLIALTEEMEASSNGWLYRKWVRLSGALRWRVGVRSESNEALMKIRDPVISAYALQQMLFMVSDKERGLVVQGRTYSRMLKAQAVETDIRRAVEALQRRREKVPDANVDAALRVLNEGR